MYLWCDQTNFTRIPAPEDIVSYAPPQRARKLFVNDSCIRVIRKGNKAYKKRLVVCKIISAFHSRKTFVVKNLKSFEDVQMNWIFYCNALFETSSIAYYYQQCPENSEKNQYFMICTTRRISYLRNKKDFQPNLCTKVWSCWNNKVSTIYLRLAQSNSYKTVAFL